MPGLNKRELLERLPAIELEKERGGELQELQQLSLGSTLGLLAQLEHDREYLICRTTAQHLLGQVPEPEDIELET